MRDDLRDTEEMLRRSRERRYIEASVVRDDDDPWEEVPVSPGAMWGTALFLAGMLFGGLLCYYSLR